ncbi:hypothetical protein AF332_20605 [Sporosarcina globispora]|uniref:DUF7210 domain-containing protein n=1 Tax=Sporosarcina globispora TaxID=1459 RepID=A0A0M0GHQ0_SPOGL|nr:hypothetical protein [Sporosarcina globispora]KON88951.1 hypothetical protein AF332_20605 [Sporosarcina globispora]
MEVKLKGKVKHNGKWYDADATIKVKQEEGDRLVKMRAAEEIESAKKSDEDTAGEKKKSKKDKE